MPMNSESTSQKALQDMSQRDSNGASENDAGKRRRLYWIDWCRSQSVWNVVCGHCWWTTKDQFGGFPTNVNQQPSNWNESTRIIEYTVDQGAFHTVPLFFLVSGFLTSCTMKTDTPGVLKFIRSRVLRTIPPFAGGAILFVIERAARGKEEDLTADEILLSHLWFLWALAIVQILLIPFCVLARMFVRQEINPTMMGVCFAIHAVICALFDVVTQIMFLKDANKPAWLAGLPVATFLSLLLLWAPGTTGYARDVCAVAGTLFMGVSTFLFAGVHEMCGVEEDGCSMYEWLSENLVQGLLLVILLYLTGFLANETTAHAQRVVAQTAREGLGVAVLLLSAVWPLFTYWGQPFIRRNGFTMTYQSNPTDPVLAPADWYYEDGRGPSWAIARMWFWVVAMLLFAKAFADAPVLPFLHRHVTQSAVVLFIVHRFFDGALAEAFHDKKDAWVRDVPASMQPEGAAGGLNEPAELFWGLLITVFTLSFASYVVINSNPFTRHAFGLLSVDKDAPPSDSEQEKVNRLPTERRASEEV